MVTEAYLGWHEFCCIERMRKSSHRKSTGRRAPGGHRGSRRVTRTSKARERKRVLNAAKAGLRELFGRD
jgi:hypothetical protein